MVFSRRANFAVLSGVCMGFRAFPAGVEVEPELRFMFAVELVAGWVIFLQWFDTLAAEHFVEAKLRGWVLRHL